MDRIEVSTTVTIGEQLELTVTAIIPAPDETVVRGQAAHTILRVDEGHTLARALMDTVGAGLNVMIAQHGVGRADD